MVCCVVLRCVVLQDKTWLERTSETVKGSVGTGIDAVQRRLGKGGGGGGGDSGYLSHNVGGYHDVSVFGVGTGRGGLAIQCRFLISSEKKRENNNFKRAFFNFAVLIKIDLRGPPGRR